MPGGAPLYLLLNPAGMHEAVTDRRASLAIRVVTLGLVATTALAIPAASRAADPSATVADLALPPVAYSHAAQTSTGTMTLTIDSATNTAGWHVTILSSPFVYSGVNNGTNIPAANLSLDSAAAPVMTSGQAIDATGGPMVGANPAGTLDIARKTVQAQAAFGQGTYTQELNVSLSIPAQTAAGSYVGTLTVTAAVGP